MKKIIIDRNTWIRGEGAQDSYLLRPRDQHRCCLGFFANQCGIEDARILGSGDPACMSFADQLPEPFRFLLKDGVRENSSVALELMELNDQPVSEDLTEQDREGRVAEIFALHGFEIEFIN